jgi:hypothetical protein
VVRTRGHRPRLRHADRLYRRVAFDGRAVTQLAHGIPARPPHRAVAEDEQAVQRPTGDAALPHGSVAELLSRLMPKAPPAAPARYTVPSPDSATARPASTGSGRSEATTWTGSVGW